jgi:putative ABC transport system substrate-binding protein
MIRRRALIALIGGAAAAWPLAARAQQPPKMLRLGTVSTLPRERRPTLRAFEQRMRELGYVEGANFLFEYTIERNVHLYGPPTQEMVRRKVDIVLTTSHDALREAMAATDTLPIVMMALDFDPFGLGYVTSLSRPTGNVTGLFLQQVELSVKRLQMLKEAFPEVDAATVFWDHRSSYQWQETERAARSLGLRLAGMELRDPPYDYDAALARVPSDHRVALLVMASPFFFGDRQKLADLSLRYRIASLFAQREHVDAGGLLSYGPSIPDMYRRLAEYVDKIARGAKTIDLPIEQPTKFEFVINLKTAKAIGKELPTSVLLRADEVIE